jgi:hypothetical protein
MEQWSGVEVVRRAFRPQFNIRRHGRVPSAHAINTWVRNFEETDSLNGEVAWPPRSPDFTACDFFLLGHLKSEVYRTRPTATEELRQRYERKLPGFLLQCYVKSYIMSITDYRNVSTEKEVIFKK